MSDEPKNVDLNEEEIQAAVADGAVEEQEEEEKQSFFSLIPKGAIAVYCFFAVSLVVYLIAGFVPDFADFVNSYFGAAVRFVTAKATGWIPFSLLETLLLSLPVLIVVTFIYYVRTASNTRRGSVRYLCILLAVALGLLGLFFSSFAVGYKTNSLDKKLGIERRDVTAEQLYETVVRVNDEMNEVINDVEFPLGIESTKMPFSLSELNDKMNAAYDATYDANPFISRLHTNLKFIALSKPMSYTHVAGFYSYFTGEANINLNFPDYVIVFTCAHEMAHQRGIAAEDEANFVAFLVCRNSDDPYVRYAGLQSMTEYLLSALSEADGELYAKAVQLIDGRSINEMTAYNRFFAEYRDSAVSKVSGAINDTYLKAQGQSAGSKSYGMVVDLAVAYYLDGE